MIFNFNTFPNLKTERLTLRELNLEDAKTILELRSNEEVNAFMTRKTPVDLRETEAFISICHHQFKNKNRLF